MAVRISMLSAAVWWAAFTFIPFRGIKNRPPANVEAVEGGLVLAQLRAALGDAEGHAQLPRGADLPDRLPVLQRRHPDRHLAGLDLRRRGAGVQPGHRAGDVPAGPVRGRSAAPSRSAGRRANAGAKKVILAGLAIWVVIVTVALFVPEGQLVPFLLLAVAIGIVLGGTQALSRSYFRLLIPAGKEAEYFSFYHAMDRGTRWFGTLVFGLVYQLTDSYRPAIFALVFFFVVGGLLLMRVDTEGIRDAGNAVPRAAV